MAIKSAISKAGGASALAVSLGVTPQVVTNWVKRGVPAERCPDIERLTGVMCEELRPDVNWGYLRRTCEAT